MSAWIPALASVTAVSLAALVGLLALPLAPASLARLASRLVSFAVGALLGDVCLHLLPECLAPGAPAARALALVSAGFLAFAALERGLRRRPRRDARALPGLALVNLAGDALHNFLDGTLIGASWLGGPALGASTTLAVLAHELPQELGDFGVLVHSGLGLRRALLFNLGSAASAVVGTVATLLAGAGLQQDLVAALLPVAAGGFLYIALVDLLPELARDRRPRARGEQLALILCGIGVMALLALAQ